MAGWALPLSPTSDIPATGLLRSNQVMTQHAKISSKALPFIDVAAQRRRLGSAIDTAIARVLDHGQFILGPEVRMLESDLARFCGAKEVIACSNGTDALALVLMAKGVKPGDAIVCPSFTFAATAEVVAWVGATPIFVDVLPDTFNVDPNQIGLAVAKAKQSGLRPVGSSQSTCLDKRPNTTPSRQIVRRMGSGYLPTRRSRSAQHTKTGTSGRSAPRQRRASIRQSRSAAMATVAQYLPATRNSRPSSVHCVSMAKAATSTTTCASE